MNFTEKTRDNIPVFELEGKMMGIKKSVLLCNRLQEIITSGDKNIILDFRKVKWTILRSCGIGTFIGILPAEGSTVAAIMGYNEAKRFSKEPEKFGTGAIEGIAGPEAANNAAAGGAMVPTLALGIPGSGTTAVILAAWQARG